MAEIANITITRGDNATQPFTVTGLGDISGSAIILTARDASGGFVFYRRNVAAGGGATECAITVGASGQFEVYFVPANTTGLSVNYPDTETLYYDVQITLASGNVYTVATGKLIVAGDVTR